MLSRFILPVHSRGTARKKNKDCSKEQAKHSNEQCPHRGREISIASASIVVHVSLDNSEKYEISDHDDDSDDPGDDGHHCCCNGTAEARSESEEEGDEGYTAGDWVENHDAGEGFGGVHGCSAKVGVVDAFHDEGWVVPDVLSCAVIAARAVGNELVLSLANLWEDVAKLTWLCNNQTYRT